MDAYRHLVYALSQILSLWIMAFYGTAKPHADLLPNALLLAAAMYLLFCAFKAFRIKARVTALFYTFCALAPWLYYAEMYFIFKMSVADPLVLQSNLEHSVVIYNLFRLIFLAVAGLCALGALIKALRGIGSH